MAVTTFVDDHGFSLRAGNLEVRLAETEEEIRAAQALRYAVFYEEMAAQPSPAMAADRRDFDAYDDVAHHLLVIDHARGKGPQAVVGTYRLIQRDGAARIGAFYSASEYDIAKVEAHPGAILELGRSCVAGPYRSGGTMQLLWRGIAAYLFHHDIEIMFGCASLPGIDADALKLPLSYLYHYHLAPPALRPKALPERYTDMRLLPLEQIDQREAIAALPPLIKGYLRLGGHVGDGAVIDQQFGTTDVAIIVKTDLVTEKYFKHYELKREQRPILAFRKD
ncbi:MULTISPECIES: GNAT family N-acetyltransferase [Inquilinus]|jgi:putative hemolysin|uniref:L-ornithine N(alpha)-acyltransferase n=1 Tax=Inquilinus ginsengisoli TaxID=363840 RepID=A0ABU1JYN7_9PROT|nr:GNAT family N-acyltransferase [Inquilinus ginsengisoli]MDR6293735.1 putative hemolysin [Inquilinus ginsengisoli]